PYERQFIPINEKAYGPYFNTKIVFFAGRILKANGETETAIARYAFPDSRKLIGQEFEIVYRYFIEIINLEPGDVLEYHYKYEIPLDVNWMHFNSGRIFHHGHIAKQDYELKLEYPKKLRNTVIGDECDDNFTANKVTTHIWKKMNLPAALDEVASRPHLDLPHIIYKFNENNISFVFKHPRTGQILPSPYHTYMIKKRQDKDFWYRRVALRRLVLDKQGRMFRSWISGVSHETDTPLEKLRKTHSDIARNFEYLSDEEYYLAYDLGLERMGTFIKERKLRDISRHNIYTKLLNRLGFENYKVLYTLDKRSGDISKDHTTNLYFGERLYFSNDTNNTFLFSKRTQTGYELNELPFYWQGTKAIGYTIGELFDEDVQAFRTTEIPIDTIPDKRSTKSEVNVKVGKGIMDFATDLKLEGQFSTLTRGVYLYNELDSTINPSYGIKIYEVGGKIYLKKRELISLMDDKPFQAEFDMEYTAVDKLQGSEDKLSISMGGLFNFVLWDDLDLENRHTTFYPDFSFQDDFSYILTFDKALEKISKENAFIENNIGSFSFSIEQLSEKEIRINAGWILTGEPVPANEMSDLEDLYDAIKDLQSKVLDLKVKV
ncbi:MAG: hypothetical protein HKN39_03035, partial [Flavobacteriales bacterium]|nr:hypothetical protein [Flavobacteriales bacterium]